MTPASSGVRDDAEKRPSTTLQKANRVAPRN